MLEATVTALHLERAHLERRVAELEADVETLEATLDRKDTQRQQIIQTYERVLAGRDRTASVSVERDPNQTPADADRTNSRRAADRGGRRQSAEAGQNRGHARTGTLGSLLQLLAAPTGRLG